jgi:signal peptidase II
MMPARKTRSRRFAAAAFLIGIAVCAVDAASKVVAVADLSPHRSVVLLGGLLRLNLYRNPGAAFGVGPPTQRFTR